jgi:hypothetical protein
MTTDLPDNTGQEQHMSGATDIKAPQNNLHAYT